MTDSILEDSCLNELSSFLETKTFYSNAVTHNIISKSCKFPKLNEIQFYQNTISKLRNFNMNDKELMNKHIENFITYEKQCKFFFEEKKSLENLEEDTFGQLIFQNDILKVFNHVPFLILMISYMKIFFVPVISTIIPIFAYFLPYLLIKYIWKMPISYELYQQIMGKMWSFSLDTSPQKMMQNIFTLFTFAQSMYQPIQNAFHLYKIHFNIEELGKYIYLYKDSVENIQNLLDKNNTTFYISKSLNNLPQYNDTHKTFIEILEQPHRLFSVSKDISKLELLWKIANHEEFNKVELYNSDVPYLSASYIVDLNLTKEKRVGSSIEIKDNKNHYLLSGPNGGGKSSFLRGMLQTVILGQTFGYSIAKDVHMTPFDFILSGLHIVDNPGKQSLFEKEILFAREVLYHNNPNYKGFVLFDEIFHSTNPPDGIRTSKIFLDKLWSYNHICSIISTHVFEIIEQSPSSVEKICVKASRDSSGIHYDYAISKGICKESSVEEIWKKSWEYCGNL
jgi:hypothetical protein